MQKYGTVEEDPDTTTEERSKYKYQNAVLLEYEDMMQEMANSLEDSKNKMTQKKEEIDACKERVRRLETKIDNQKNEIEWLGKRVEE